MWILQKTSRILFSSTLLLLTACGGSGNSGNTGLDTTPPVITLHGDSTITLPLGRSYSEPGASANDNEDGVVEVAISGAIDTSTLGNYTLTYTAKDTAGNSASITRDVIVAAPRPFITTWETNVNGKAFSDDNQIMIDTDGTGYDYQVDWGDGTVDEHVTGDIVHTYAAQGTYTVTINGSFPQLYFEAPIDEYYNLYSSDHNKLRSIEQWGDIQWRSMHRAFAGCKSLVGNATDKPDLSNVSNMSSMFEGAEIFNQDLSSWDVSNVTNMSAMFFEAKVFNQALSSWDVSNVTDMSDMFFLAGAFNQDLNSWDVSNVTDMNGMFSFAEAFNQDLNSWDVSKVTNMGHMFSQAKVFNQDLSNWDVSNVTEMGAMFFEAKAFNQDLSNWDVSNVMSMHSMFRNASNFNQDLSSWDVSNATNLFWMFEGVTLSTENYDALLTGWLNFPLQHNIAFHAGNSQYSNSAQSARDVLTATYGWNISDGGVAN
ncbi:BspA family leucine-rich repeat surface protein [Thalassomonas actiniarum]|uniref:BspA family leucine-rich repeat surface protein n=1 Tax=Thalassomonas actiniarum TaxID=485447 RepID=A0AAE9YYB8_9GAMM|nr:BspA family leucine-rich repeat surface protein [Thalassomonas actiniarum]WDE02604.1 BspA family leucine-rich repeat surface protein [Thalassomonas actiniarum]